MQEIKLAKKALHWFLILTLGISFLLEATYVLLGGRVVLILALLMWVPGIIAVCIRRKYYRQQPLLGMRLGGIRYLLAGILIPLLYFGASYGAYWLFFEESFLGISSDGMPMYLFLILNFLTSILTAAGEEIGWRGFMYPAMEKVWNRKIALLASGGIWAAWHMLPMVCGLYGAEIALGYGLVMFTVEVMGISVIMAWLRMRSNSVWPAIFLHGTHNLLDQQIFQVSTSHPNSAYFVGEQGFMTAIIVVAIATVVLVLWRKKDTLRES